MYGWPALWEASLDWLLPLCGSAKKPATSSMKIAGRVVDATYLPLAYGIDREVASTERCGPKDDDLQTSLTLQEIRPCVPFVSIPF
jgi:hypothetical protein